MNYFETIKLIYRVLEFTDKSKIDQMNETDILFIVTHFLHMTWYCPRPRSNKCPKIKPRFDLDKYYIFSRLR